MYINILKIGFNPEKDVINLKKYRLSLPEADMIALLKAKVIIDGRSDYSETRYRAFSRMAILGYCLMLAVREAIVRPISFCRAREN